MFIAGIVTTILATALHLLVRAVHIEVPYLAGVLKMTASTAFIATAVSAGAFQSRVGAAILLGLFFSWFGDLFLIRSGPNFFLAGLVAFFAGHLCYSAAFALHQARLPLAGVALAIMIVPGSLLARWILPGVTNPGLKAPVIAYMCVISIMLALAAGCLTRPAGLWMFAGALLFYLSDIFVARAAFVSPGFVNSVLGLPLYFGGQLLLAISIAYANKPPTPA